MATGLKVRGKCQWAILEGPISVAWVCGCSLAGFAGSVPAGGVDVYCVCCQVDVCAMGRSLVQRSSTECGVCECHHEASIMRRPWPTSGCCSMENKDWRGVLFWSITGPAGVSLLLCQACSFTCTFAVSVEAYWMWQWTVQFWDGMCELKTNYVLQFIHSFTVGIWQSFPWWREMGLILWQNYED
jgi:hypothetical protein